MLALQAFEPLLLVSTDVSKQHSSTLAALVTDSTTPPALLLQAVDTAGELTVVRPAESSLLVQHLEQLLLAVLAATCHTAAGTAADGTAAADGAFDAADGQCLIQASCPQTALRHAIGTCGDAQGKQRPPAAAAAAGVVSAVAAAEAAARWYCRLLLSEKLLLTGHSWGVVAEGLLATGPLQVCVCNDVLGGVLCCVGCSDYDHWYVIRSLVSLQKRAGDVRSGVLCSPS